MKQFKIVIFIFLFVQLGFFMPSSLATSLSPVQVTYQKNNITSLAQGPIIINGNSQLAALASSGTGTNSSPFILQNYVITGNSSTVGITIENTTEHFIVKNVSISYCGTGVSFGNVTGGSLVNSFLSNNSQGVEIRNSSMLTFTGNYVFYNGIGFLFRNNSTDILLYLNIIGNNGIGIYSAMNYATGVINSFFNTNSVHDNNWGFYFLNHNQLLNDSFISNYAGGNKFSGFYFQSSINNTFRNNDVSNNQQDGFYLASGKNNLFTLNKVSYNNQNGFNFNQSSSNSINSNQADNNNGNGYFLSQGSAFNSIYNNTADNNKANGFLFSQSSSNNVTYNEASNNKLNGFTFNATSIDNTITDNNAQSNTNDGFFLENDLINNVTSLYQITMSNNSAIGNYNIGFELNNSNYVDIVATISSNNLLGFNIYNCYKVTLANNVIDNNIQDGLHINFIQAGTIINNTAINNGWANYYNSNSQIVTFQSNTFPVNVPSEPLFIKLDLISNNEVNVTWSKPVTDGGGTILNYNIYRSTDGVNYSLIASTTELFFIDYNPVPGKDNSYEISAVNSAGEGRRSFNFVAAVIQASGTISIGPISTLPGGLIPKSSLDTQSPMRNFLAHNQGASTIGLLLIIGVIGLLAYGYISYRKYNVKVDPGKKIPFTKYLQKKLLKKSQRNTVIVQPHEIEKSLEIIEEILDESQSGK